MTKYTQMTLAWLRAEGWEPAVVERWVPNPRSKAGGVRRDLFGVADIVAVRPGRTVAVQSTGPSGHAAHRRDMLASVGVPSLVAAGWEVWLVSWRKLLVRRGGRARRWRPRVEDVGALVAAVDLLG